MNEYLRTVEPIATVVNNNVSGEWLTVVQTDPNVTLEIGEKLYRDSPVLGNDRLICAAIVATQFSDINYRNGRMICDVQELLNKLNTIKSEMSVGKVKSRQQEIEIEKQAKIIYETWQKEDDWVPWVAWGNSDKQYEARRLARKFLIKAKESAPHE